METWDGDEKVKEEAEQAYLLYLNEAGSPV